MAAATPTIDSVWRSLVGQPMDDGLVHWPPDLFALTEMILEHSEAYRFVVSPPAGEHWPPPSVPAWADAVVSAGVAWTVWALDRLGPPPDLVAREWDILMGSPATPIESIADGSEWRICEALLTLHAIADEACAGMGVAVEGSQGIGCALRGRGRELLARTGSLARLGSPGLRVLPKVRTPAGGISLRSLSRYACVRGPGVEPVWHKVPAQRPGGDPRRQPANILLLPWPLKVRDSDFRPLAGTAQRAEREPFAFFDFVPAEHVDLDLVDRLLAAARDEVDIVDMVVLPESAVPADVIGDLEAVLARHRVGAVVAGVRDSAPQPGLLPGNWVHLGVLLGGRWWHYRQNKHHRWSLDESQILQYHLGGALHPGLRWWESMEVPRRSIQFVELGGGITIVALVCEDLARLDAVADLLRTVGPTLVLTVLLDGPQLASRWTARYASVLADDPGSAVLTLTSFGMVDRSRPGGVAPSRVVALWKDPTGSIREISLDAGAVGVLLSTCVDRASRQSADGRWPTDDTAHLRDVGVHQLRVPAVATAAAPIVAAPAPTDEPGLDERELTIVSSWAEVLAEAATDEEALMVVRDAAPGSTWRATFDLEEPSVGLGAALTALAHVAGPGGATASDGDPIVGLVRRLLRSAGEARQASRPRDARHHEVQRAPR